jgi:hypothetical protein
MDSRITAMRPMRDLLKRLPMLPVMSGEIDFPAADKPLTSLPIDAQRVSWAILA